jgi:hypothetical protein
MTLTLSALAAASVAVFMLAFWRLKIVSSARSAIAIMQNALGVMRDPALDELAREKAVQSASLKLVREAFSLIVRSALALAAAFIPLALADQFGLAPLSGSLEYLARWDVIIVISVVVLFIWVVGGRVWRK